LSGFFSISVVEQTIAAEIFSHIGEAALSLILGENYTVYLQQGKKKLYVNSILGENCMIFKEFFFGEAAL
jgi:hypothetical protein